MPSTMESEVGISERRYRLLRKQLDELGYLITLPIEALPLVERLTSDLLHTTDSLRHYKEIAQKSLEERAYFENGVEPYKHENAKLIRECNDLHIKLLKNKEEAEKQQKSFKCQIRKLQSENSDFKFLSSQHLLQVKELEKESAEKTLTVIRLQNKAAQPVVITPGGKKAPLRSRASLEIDAPLDPPKSWKDHFWSASAQIKDPYIANMVEVCDDRICALSKEVNLLKEERSQQSEKLSLLENKILNRDREIERLTCMLEGGRPLSAIGKDYGFKEMEVQLRISNDEVKRLEKENKELQAKLKESTASQHEALSRVYRLTERNRQLEIEMRDIDHMALTVEAECNSAVEDSNKKVHKIQEKLTESVSQITSLEREILEIKRSSQEQQAELEKLRLEKHKLQKQLDNTREEKKKLIDRINSFTVIEKDLMMEIDRLTQLSSKQKRRVAELETRILNYTENSASSSKSKHAAALKNQNSGFGDYVGGGAEDTATNTVVPAIHAHFPNPYLPIHCKFCGVPYKEEHLTSSLEIQLQQLQAERDHFKKEYQNLQNQIQNIPTHPDPMAGGDGSSTFQRIQRERDHYKKEFEELQEKMKILADDLQQKAKGIVEEADSNTRLRRRLSDKEKEMEKLHQCIQDLNYEKQSLQKRVDGRILSAVTRSSMTSPVIEGPGQSVRAVLNRCLRERDLAKGDVVRLEEERDALRERLKVSTETQVTEHARLEKTIMESEDRVRRLELERRELMTTAGVQKATINNLEDELESLQEKHHASQSELSQQRSLYSQIKSLQEQTDRALADSQGQLAQLEAELANAKERIRTLENDRASLDREVSSLKTEQTVLRGNLAQVDQEKDALLLNIDSKTEQIVQLERQLKMNESKVVDLEGNVVELQKKLDISLDENAAREQAVRAAEREVQALRAEAAALEGTRAGVLRENRRLQDDLAAATLDVRQAHRDREQALEEVEDLKRQLREYVTEVQRIEQRLAEKDNERTEMLEHFRGLTEEASMLESNNQSLESQATEHKQQLDCAEERIAELEQQLDDRESLVQSYGNQIADLTANIACLETQVQQHEENRKKTDADLDALRDLCVKLDSQKETLQQQLNKQDVVKIQWETEISRLQDEQDLLQEHLSKDRASIASLENMLASSRQETAEQRHQNEELKVEVERLQLRVDTLQSKLDAETAELHRFQYQANEYSRQIKELQRQITNERFERARATEENRRMKDSCSPCPAKVTLQPCPAIVPGRPPSPLIPYGGPQARAADWNKKVLAPCGRFPPCDLAGSTTPPCVRRKPLYMTPAPSTDWMTFRPSVFPKVVSPTYTTESPVLQPGMADSKSMGPVSSQARQTCLIGPRAISPLMAPPAPGEPTTRGFYSCSKPCSYGYFLRGPPFVPPGIHIQLPSGGIHAQTPPPPLVEKSAGGHPSAKCCPCPVSLPSSELATDKPLSPSSEPAPSTSAGTSERRASSR